jgi:hypothetical protein
MRNERRTSGSGMGAAETCAGNRASAPRPHFHWRRAKRFWTGQYTGSQSHDPGLTYDRASVTVAVRTLPADRALNEEARLIARLRPRDNLVGQPEDFEPAEAVPF